MTQKISFLTKGEMLDAIKAHLNMSKNAEFARFLGISSQAVSNWYSRNTFDAELLYTKCDFISPDWLLTGRGSMLREERQPEAKQEPLVTTNADIINIPIVDISVAAGSGYINPDYIEEVDSIAMPSSMIKDGKKYLCVRVKGQSMVPSILDGGYLIVRQMERYEWKSVRDNYVYVVSDTEGRAYVKRLKNRLRQHGFVVCMSDNADKQNYPNFNLYEEELNSIWYAEWYFSAKIPNIQETYYRKQGELEDRLDELTTEIKEIQKRLNENK